jgi:phosphate transport system substrate-binding protein
VVCIVLCVAAAAAGYAYFSRPSAAAGPASRAAITICPGAGSPQLVSDLVRGYAAKTGTPADLLRIGNGTACDVRFLTAASSPDAVIARDGIVAVVNPLNPIARISEEQLRGIFSGSIRNWSEVGGPPDPIVALLPSDATEAGKLIAASLFFGIPIGRNVDRPATSADVTRAVTGADRRSRDAIGIVAFSAAVPAKVIPLAYLPAPSTLTIANRLYPYTLTVAVDTGTGRADPSAAAGFVSYARSSDGAEIVAKNGLIGRGGP